MREEARRLSDRIYRERLAPAGEALVRRILFGPDTRGRLADLYAAGEKGSSAPPDGLKGFLAPPARRAALAEVFRRACLLITCPAGVIAALARRRGAKPR
ncbi:MAG: hypothetical protein KGL74_05985 [Elusimicrobia bacterium]|nr:hypothetical protein [Elusimicrobiota bacterium]MDE2510654.1 hypothetical protein [Elusimicrobiota bacterium]